MTKEKRGCAYFDTPSFLTAIPSVVEGSLCA